MNQNINSFDAYENMVDMSLEEWSARWTYVEMSWAYRALYFLPKLRDKIRKLKHDWAYGGAYCEDFKEDLAKTEEQIKEILDPSTCPWWLPIIARVRLEDVAERVSEVERKNEWRHML